MKHICFGAMRPSAPKRTAALYEWQNNPEPFLPRFEVISTWEVPELTSYS
ncbi:hypothetical protein ABIF38_001010 [Bradyrhizobium japonicum]|uniref:Uncharacterized protein n=1 Tax=Bradyrhizobium elkanii TaxID=29448 RepID=A0ABV4ERD0_BRAEL|nr:hypothetical protein [Bradyrhizobium elkanii]MCP1736672.1 hypothetical protein [Bradyrhizobium elkanii]MCP1754717.1 hypothetical protein [Bradyrhizobium elkanii]MCP1980233.1 hypothetical protein [Bradyrhizobium elkanii]MCS3572012.1 hypothetical protein [Bradyrhizobium elkanii]